MRLLVFKVNQLGDNIVFLPVVQCLERAMPQCEIIVATSHVAVSIYRSCTPRVKVIEFDTKTFNQAWRNIFPMVRLIRLMRSIKPDACLVANDQGNVAHLLAWCSGARLRLGAFNDRVPCSRLLTHRVALDHSSLIAAQNWQLMLAFLDASGADRDAVPVHPPAPDLSALRSSETAQDTFVLIHPGGSREYQRWFAERYVELANRLSKRIAVRYVMQGDVAEASLSSEVHRVQPVSLESFFGLMSQASFFIGNNSGPMHMASCFGIPSIVFSGPSAPAWRPAWNAERITMLHDPSLPCQPCDRLDGPVNVCLNKSEPMACMKRFSVDMVERLTLERLRLS